MKIIEEFILGKKQDQALCEDNIVKTSDFIAIIDGATAQSDHTFDQGITTGKMASLLISRSIKSFPEKTTMAQAATIITQDMAAFYIKSNHTKKINTHPRYKCTASAVVYSRHLHQLWFFGDCQATTLSGLYTDEKIIDKIVSNTRAMYLPYLLKQGYQVSELLEFDLSREVITPLLKNQQFYQNVAKSEHEFGFVCLDGSNIPLEDVKVVQLNDTDHTISLASDGYPEIKNSLQASEKHLRYIESIDPLCYQQYKSTKGFLKCNNSYDDRAYIKFTVD
jgi:glycerophosphoryl diester phosphodiesterase